MDKKLKKRIEDGMDQIAPNLLEQILMQDMKRIETEEE